MTSLYYNNLSSITNTSVRWADGDISVTLDDVLKLSSETHSVDPNTLKHLLIDVVRDKSRIEDADLSYPILVSVSEGVVTKILDGQHRVVKAMRDNQFIKVRYLNLDTATDEMKHLFK